MSTTISLSAASPASAEEDDAEAECPALDSSSAGAISAPLVEALVHFRTALLPQRTDRYRCSTAFSVALREAAKGALAASHDASYAPGASANGLGDAESRVAHIEATATFEGLHLVPDSTSRTGYWGVTYEAHAWPTPFGIDLRPLGGDGPHYFSLAPAAALALARGLNVLVERRCENVRQLLPPACQPPSRAEPPRVAPLPSQDVPPHPSVAAASQPALLIPPASSAVPSHAEAGPLLVGGDRPSLRLRSVAFIVRRFLDQCSPPPLPMSSTTAVTVLDPPTLSATRSASEDADDTGLLDALPDEHATATEHGYKNLDAPLPTSDDGTNSADAEMGIAESIKTADTVEAVEVAEAAEAATIDLVETLGGEGEERALPVVAESDNDNEEEKAEEEGVPIPALEEPEVIDVSSSDVTVTPSGMKKRRRNNSVELNIEAEMEEEVVEAEAVEVEAEAEPYMASADAVMPVPLSVARTRRHASSSSSSLSLPPTTKVARIAWAVAAAEIVLSPTQDGPGEHFMAAGTKSGYKCVYYRPQVSRSNPYVVVVSQPGESKRHLGSFATSTAAADCYALYMRGLRAMESPAAPVVPPPPPPPPRGDAPVANPSAPAPLGGLKPDMAAAEAIACAAAEGLSLEMAFGTASGFKCVQYRPGLSKLHPYHVSIRHAGARLHLGSFSHVQAAALCYARHVHASAAGEEPLIGGEKISAPAEELELEVEVQAEEVQAEEVQAADADEDAGVQTEVETEAETEAEEMAEVTSADALPTVTSAVPAAAENSTMTAARAFDPFDFSDNDSSHQSIVRLRARRKLLRERRAHVEVDETSVLEQALSTSAEADHAMAARAEAEAAVAEAAAAAAVAAAAEAEAAAAEAAATEAQAAVEAAMSPPAPPALLTSRSLRSLAAEVSEDLLPQLHTDCDARNTRLHAHASLRLRRPVAVRCHSFGGAVGGASISRFLAHLKKTSEALVTELVNGTCSVASPSSMPPTLEAEPTPEPVPANLDPMRHLNVLESPPLAFLADTADATRTNDENALRAEASVRATRVSLIDEATAAAHVDKGAALPASSAPIVPSAITRATPEPLVIDMSILHVSRAPSEFAPTPVVAPIDVDDLAALAEPCMDSPERPAVVLRAPPTPPNAPPVARGAGAVGRGIHKKGPYLCRVCSMPKKGHVCAPLVLQPRGIPGRPMRVSEEARRPWAMISQSW